ncbi:MAG TPA: sigma factor-like helix-turn-helix DNA-binding protein [Gemmatimonadaceae bacterium]
MIPQDRAARLSSTYHATLMRFLSRRLDDRDAAEKIARETVERVAVEDDEEGERSTIFAAAIGLARADDVSVPRAQRRLALMRADAETDIVSHLEATHAKRPAEQAMARQAFETLAPRDRDALLMREEGLRYDEIAAVLDVPATSVGSTLARARRRLMEAYEVLLNAPEPA